MYLFSADNFSVKKNPIVVAIIRDWTHMCVTG